jgi:hypothetical protein
LLLSTTASATEASPISLLPLICSKPNRPHPSAVKLMPIKNAKYASNPAFTLPSYHFLASTLRNIDWKADDATWAKVHNNPHVHHLCRCLKLDSSSGSVRRCAYLRRFGSGNRIDDQPESCFRCDVGNSVSNLNRSLSIAG